MNIFYIYGDITTYRKHHHSFVELWPYLHGGMAASPWACTQTGFVCRWGNPSLEGKFQQNMNIGFKVCCTVICVRSLFPLPHHMLQTHSMMNGSFLNWAQETVLTVLMLRIERLTSGAVLGNMSIYLKRSAIRTERWVSFVFWYKKKTKQHLLSIKYFTLCS